MTILDRLFRRGAKSATPQAPGASAECPHLALTPRWDRSEDIGHEDRATSYVCDSCHRSFAPSAVEGIRHAAADRLRIRS